MIHIFSTSQSSTLVLMGLDLEDTSISRTRSTMQWFMWGGWLKGEFSLHRGSEIDMPFTEERGLRERYKSNHPSQGYQLRFDHRAGKFILAHQHLKLTRA